MGSVPEHRLQLDLSRYPKLDAAQAGHLRHFHNLANQLDGEWHHMAGFESQQELFDAFRYQLAMMAYATGLAHYHRLPAARSVFKPLMEQIIHKMLLRDVWGYWYNASLSGKYVDRDLKELRKPWADPIVKENIMYSGHILMMTSMYAMLFDDDRYEREGSLTFNWNPLLWGLGHEKYVYDNRSIQKAVLAEMERSNWIGVCCEPNLIFVVCNQFPIIAMRYNDVRDGTDLASEVIAKYRAAWEKKGMVTPSGLYVDWIYENQGEAHPPSCIVFTAWANAFMNVWNSDLIDSLYERQALGYITNVDGEVRLHDHDFAVEYRKLAQASENGGHAGHDTAAAVLQARGQRWENRQPDEMDTYVDPVFGCVVAWLSEVGRTTELRGLLDYADEHLSPEWERGGLFYPRRDPAGPFERGDEWVHCDPFTGNSGIAYARLNVKDGQKGMFEKPWTREYLAAQPWVDGVELSRGIDVLRAIWDAERAALVTTLKTWHGGSVAVEVRARNVEPGHWDVYVGGTRRDAKQVGKDGCFPVTVEVGGEEVDIVYVRQS